MNTQERIVRYNTADKLTDALKRLVENKDVLDNFVSYLTSNYEEWIKKFASDFSGFTEEIEQFSKIYDEKDE